ncbi:MAG TPA: response regulator [Longimicrobiales bacterium]|nr:response regulator [Longimicrobiales bacterium]
MSAGRWAVPDVRVLLDAAADEVREALGLDTVLVVLLRGRRGRPEITGVPPFPEALAGALLRSAGGQLVSLARRSDGPVLLRPAGPVSDADALTAVLREQGLETVAVFPLLGEVGTVACLLLPAPSGWEWPRGGGRPGLALMAPAALQAAAGASLLEAVLEAGRGRGGRIPSGAVVVDGHERVILADGAVRDVHEWRHPDPFGCPLTDLPATPLREAASSPEGVIAGGGRVLLARATVERGCEAGAAWPLRLAARVHAAAGAVVGALRSGLPLDALQVGILGQVAQLASESRVLARRCADEAAAAGDVVGVDLAEVAGSILEDCADVLGRNRVRVLSFIAPARCHLPGDLLAPHGVLAALIARARTSLEGVGGTLTVRTWTEESWACAAVSHDGGSRAARAAAPERQGDAGEGSGPLDEVSAVVESLGGRFQVESRPGVWHRCTVMLPTQAARAALPRRTETRVRRAESGGLSVLVVDDNAALRSILRRYLERRGHRVTEARDGEDALFALAGGESFDRLIVDIQMPGKSGPELYGSLVRVAPQLRSHTLFMTGDLLEPDTERFLAESGRPAIAKPFDLAELARRLEDVA